LDLNDDEDLKLDIAWMMVGERAGKRESKKTEQNKKEKQNKSSVPRMRGSCT